MQMHTWMYWGHMWLAAGHTPKALRFPEFFRKRERSIVDIFGELMGPTMCICIHVHAWLAGWLTGVRVSEYHTTLNPKALNPKP